MQNDRQEIQKLRSGLGIPDSVMFIDSPKKLIKGDTNEIVQRQNADFARLKQSTKKPTLFSGTEKK